MGKALGPIGVFDSGIGGLTVVRELFTVMPQEDIVYLGDTARVPYGTRSPETVRRYAVEGVRFLRKMNIKLLVVACNTVSAVGLDRVREELDAPVLGVIEPGARAAVRNTSCGIIGVIGTEATVRSGAYRREIEALSKDAVVHSLSCPLFVPLVEEGWLEGPVPELVAERYLREMISRGMDTLVLGCTHYPLLKPVIERISGRGIGLIDSAQETAREAYEVLVGRGLLKAAEGANPRREFYVTDSPEKFRDVGERFLGVSIGEVQKVDLEVYNAA